MNAKSAIGGFLLSAVIFAAILVVYQRNSGNAAQVEREKVSAQLSDLNRMAAVLQEKLAGTEKERDRLKADAAEVFRLRGEISTLRKENEALKKQLAHAASAPKPVEATAQTETPEAAPARGQYGEIGFQAANIRKRLRDGTPLTPEERAWLDQVKPELEKLESSPKEFAEFQANMIQNMAGINDPAKVQKIQETIQRVYEAAGARGLTIPGRPGDDPAWVEQRHQLDRRGTGAVQKLLDENERTAFDRAFIGIMGPDLGTGVDKSLYPPGFIREGANP